MNARDKELLAWLENAITAREQTARLAPSASWEAKVHEDLIGDEGWENWQILGALPSGETRLIAGAGYEGGGVFGEAAARHIALNDPESVLQRCAADRVLVDVFTPILKNGNKMERTLASYTLRQIALGYGWATTLPGLKEAVELAYQSGTRAEYTAACEAYEEARAKKARSVQTEAQR